MSATRPDTPQAEGADSVAHDGAGDALSETLKLVEQWSIIDDLTKSDRKEYIKSLAALDAAMERCRIVARSSNASHELLSLMAYAIFHAHKIGTYKTPTQSSPEKGVLNVLLTPTTKKPTAGYVDLLEKLDPDFKNRRERMKAQVLRDAKSNRRHDHEAAILYAILTVRGDGPSAHPDAEAGRIRVRVNKILEKENHVPVSKDVIYRRLKKYPRS